MDFATRGKRQKRHDGDIIQYSGYAEALSNSPTKDMSENSYNQDTSFSQELVTYPIDMNSGGIKDDGTYQCVLQFHVFKSNTPE